jgi:hypothetical protein
MHHSSSAAGIVLVLMILKDIILVSLSLSDMVKVEFPSQHYIDAVVYQAFFAD